MWFIFSLITVLFWSFGDMFCKSTSDSDDKLSHWRIVISVGFVMGLHAVTLLVSDYASGAKDAFRLVDIVTYSPISFFYILSMIIGYVGLRYLAVSIVSPISNTSGAFTFILLIIFGSFSEIDGWQIAGTIAITLGVVMLAIIEQQIDKRERIKSGEKIDRKYTHGALALLFPILYCIFDTLGTFGDGMVLDEWELMSEHAALIAYELTFFLMAIYAVIHIKFIKKGNVFMGKDSWKMIFPGLCETAGQYFYTYAMVDKAYAAAPLISCYCLFSMLWGRVFLKEKLTARQYVSLGIACVGILFFGISESFAELGAAA